VVQNHRYDSFVYIYIIDSKNIDKRSKEHSFNFQNGTRLIVDGRPELSKYNNGKFCLAVLEDEFDQLSVSKWYCDNETERKRYLFGEFLCEPTSIVNLD
jgi:hypothetical protein